MASLFNKSGSLLANHPSTVPLPTASFTVPILVVPSKIELYIVSPPPTAFTCFTVVVSFKSASVSLPVAASRTATLPSS